MYVGLTDRVGALHPGPEERVHEVDDRRDGAEVLGEVQRRIGEHVLRLSRRGRCRRGGTGRSTASGRRRRTVGPRRPARADRRTRRGRRCRHATTREAPRSRSAADRCLGTRRSGCARSDSWHAARTSSSRSASRASTSRSWKRSRPSAASLVRPLEDCRRQRPEAGLVDRLAAEIGIDERPNAPGGHRPVLPAILGSTPSVRRTSMQASPRPRPRSPARCTPRASAWSSSVRPGSRSRHGEMSIGGSVTRVAGHSHTSRHADGRSSGAARRRCSRMRAGVSPSSTARRTTGARVPSGSNSSTASSRHRSSR